MKVGINLPAQFPFDSTDMMLPVYEEMGADTYWAPDHILGVFHPGLWADTPLSAMAADPDAFYDPFVYGARVGTMTDKAYGISVTDSTRRGAADLARTALSLNDLIPGGFILGIGSGEAESLLPFGYPFDTPVAKLEDCLVEQRAQLDETLLQLRDRSVERVAEGHEALGLARTDAKDEPTGDEVVQRQRGAGQVGRAAARRVGHRDAVGLVGHRADPRPVDERVVEGVGIGRHGGQRGVGPEPRVEHAEDVVGCPVGVGAHLLVDRQHHVGAVEGELGGEVDADLHVGAFRAGCDPRR